MQNRQTAGARSPRELELALGKERAESERLELAHAFKFAAQAKNPRIARPVPYGRVGYKGFYSEHKAAFDRLHFILSKYNIPQRGFAEYAAGLSGAYTPEFALRGEVFRSYAGHVARERKYADIHRSYEACVKRLAELCVERGITVREYLLDAVRTNRLATEYLSGRLSKYFLAAMQGFRGIYGMLDPMSKSELRIIYDAADELRVMVNEALVKEAGRYPRPLGDVEAAIQLLKKTKNNKQQENQPCACSAQTCPQTNTAALTARRS